VAGSVHRDHLWPLSWAFAGCMNPRLTVVDPSLRVFADVWFSRWFSRSQLRVRCSDPRSAGITPSELQRARELASPLLRKLRGGAALHPV